MSVASRASFSITKTARRRTLFVLPPLVCRAALAAAHWDPAGRLDNLYLDWNLRSLAVRLPADPGIVMIDIDEPTLEAMVPEYGRYPWTRAVYGQLLEGLARQQPAAPEARAALLLPLPGLSQTGRLGTINVFADADGVVRRYPMHLETYGWRIASLPARLARDLGYSVPATENLMITWHGPPRSYRTVSFYDVFTDLDRKQPQRPAEEFRGRIVIVGTTASGLHDLKLTPMGANYPGTEVLATTIDNLKNGERLRVSPAWIMPATTALVLLVLAIGFTRGISPLPLGAGLLVFTVALAAGGWAAMAFGRTVIPVASAPLFPWLS